MLSQFDLFGGESEVVSSGSESDYQKFKRMNNYRIAENKSERCFLCIHCFRKEFNNKGYYKCELIGCSSSMATDVRIKNTCSKFMPKRKEVEVI